MSHRPPAYDQIILSVAGISYRVNYITAGSGSKTLVLLHGSGPGATSHSNFIRNIDFFIQSGFKLLLVDFPGWGKSDPIICNGSRTSFNASVLKSLINKLSLNKVHIIGNSMGAHTAVAFTLANPERVCKLILMGGGTGGISHTTPMPTEGIKLLQKVYRHPTLDNLREMMEAFVYDKSQITEDLLKNRLNNILESTIHLNNFVKSLDINPKQFPDLTSRLHELYHPVMIVWGRDDRFIPLDIGAKLLSYLPNAELHVFGKCGHWVQWEHAERFNQLSTQFLNA